MPAFFTQYQDDLPYFAREAGCTLPEGAQWYAYSADGPDGGAFYVDALRQAFNFLRRHDDGRYSSRMKMRVLNAADKFDTARDAGAAIDAEAMPGVVLLQVPYSYDEDTEVKSGGILGVAVVWPSEGGRLMLAVNRQFRRQRLGSLLVSLLDYPVQAGGLTSWVARTNTVGQHFLLERGFTASGFNQSGGICWTRGSVNTDDGVEDHVDPLDQVRPRRNSRRRQYRDEYLVDPLVAEEASARWAEAPTQACDNPECDTCYPG